MARMQRALATATICVGVLACGPPSRADTADASRLAARCTVCHSASAQAAIPLLEGQPKAYFVAQMRAFRDRRRTAPVMVNLADELSEHDVASLAGHYAAREPDRPDSPSNPATIEAGRSTAAALRCARCHGPAMQGSDSGAARLAGQKPRYTAWTLQLMRGGSRSHGVGKDPIADLSNDDIEALAEYFASLR